MTPIAASEIPSEVVAIILGALGVIYMIVVKSLEHDKETKRMKLESELKVKLSENLKDPEAIERIANLKVLRGEKPGDAEHKIVQEHQKLALANARQRAKSSEPRIGRYVLPGLICLMLGVGLVIADAASNGAEALSIPGFIVGAIGLSLLSYAVFLQDMAKKAYERQQSDRGYERVP